MSYIVAFAGKGGVGKSTLAALTVRYLSDKRKRPILVVDADPNYCLPELLGVSINRTLASVKEEALKNKPEYIPLDEWLEIQVNKIITESKNFDLIVMGRPERDGCYCAVNNVLKRVIKEISGNYNYTVVDNEAGMEHLSRGILNKIDVLFTVSSPAKSSIQAALRIRELLKELNISLEKIFLVINQAQKKLDESEEKYLKRAFEDIYYVYFDREILNLSEEGKSVFSLSEGSVSKENFYQILEVTFDGR
ncbi:MAG: AAA family ATPase [Thermodesulfovibrio sp.]|nr:AAA family ATPase [Thermodesulfovibrio sp.]